MQGLGFAAGSAPADEFWPLELRLPRRMSHVGVGVGFRT